MSGVDRDIRRAQSRIYGKPSASGAGSQLVANAPVGSGADWATLTGKPATFPPSGHTHPEAEIVNLTGDLAAKAPLSSPALSGVPTAPTANPGTNTAQIATTAFVQAASGGGGSSPLMGWFI